MLLGRVKYLSRGDIACPTACMGEPLRFRQIGLAPTQRLLCALALGDVTNGTGDKRAFLRLQRTETDFHGKLGAVFPASVSFQTHTHWTHSTLREQHRAVFGV